MHLHSVVTPICAPRFAALVVSVCPSRTHPKALKATPQMVMMASGKVRCLGQMVAAGRSNMSRVLP